MRHPASRAAIAAFLLIAVSAAPTRAQEPLESAQAVASARTLAESGRHGDAVASLKNHLARFPDDVDARLLLGIVLSWQRKFDDSREALREVLRVSPQYADALAALRNVELWSAQDARSSEVTTGVTVDVFSDGRGPWRETFASIRHATSIGPVTLRGAAAQRLAISDHQFEIDMYPKIRGGTHAYVAFAVAPNERLYPKYRYAADIYQALGAGFEGSVGFRRLVFTTSTDIYVASLSKYAGPWLLAGRLFVVPRGAAPDSRSFHGSVRRYFGARKTSYVGGRYGRGLTREEIRSVNEFEVVRADTIGVDLRVEPGRRWLLSLSASTSRQDRVNRANLRHHSLAAAVGFRF